MVDSLVARCLLGIIAIFMALAVGGSAIRVAEAKLAKDTKNYERYCLWFTVEVFIQFVLIVALAFN